MLVKDQNVVEARKALEKVLEGSTFLPLNLQFFADDDGGGSDDGDGGDDADKSGGNDDDKDSRKDQNDPKNTNKTFTQDDVNNIAAKEAKKATEKLLKQLGVADFKTAKEGLEKFKEIQDSQKTDAQKAIDKAQTLENENTGLSGQVKILNAQLAALKADVSPDSLEDVIVLANNLVSEETSIDQAIEQVLKKYPNFKRAGSDNKSTDTNKKPKFTDGDHKNDNKPNEMEQWAAAFKLN